MTPEAIRTISQVRHEFYKLFAAEISEPVNITKGNSYSSNTAKVSWIDRYQRPNYACLYAHIAPDRLLPDRPLILRLGVNQGLNFEPTKRHQELHLNRQKLLRFELTLLPDEILKFVPWLISLLQTHEKGSGLITPPCLLNFDTLDELLLYGAWTQKAEVAFCQSMPQKPLVASQF
ncbi:hypothetical protein [Almyronema epifaneia]|uniref:Uncharacterized protein n=1 Tax=Almyronema epifaneia S1 TaxID=2991925 RepID=A0ABW6IJ53_9CYAN